VKSVASVSFWGQFVKDKNDYFWETERLDDLKFYTRVTGSDICPVI
jgi:hypothetical protein